MERAFCRLQQAFITAPVLVYYNLGKSIQLETDVSSFAIAGILSQPMDQNCRKAPKGVPTPDKKVARNWHPAAF
jgi:hypothetical protein